MCGDGDSMLVYAYAHGGKRFDMPNDVGYRAGGSKSAPMWIDGCQPGISVTAEHISHNRTY